MITVKKASFPKTTAPLHLRWAYYYCLIQTMLHLCIKNSQLQTHKFKVKNYEITQ